jgi:hypothetical protein
MRMRLLRIIIFVLPFALTALEAMAQGKRP